MIVCDYNLVKAIFTVHYALSGTLNSTHTHSLACTAYASINSSINHFKICYIDSLADS